MKHIFLLISSITNCAAVILLLTYPNMNKFYICAIVAAVAVTNFVDGSLK